MAKVKVKFDKKIEVGGKTLEGEVNIEKPNMGQMADACSLCPPTNQIGFTMAAVSVILDIPYNAMRAMNTDDYLEMLSVMEPHLPKI